MIKEKAQKVGLAVAPFAALAAMVGMQAHATDDASVTAVNGVASTFIGDITSIVTTNLPLIFGAAIIIVGAMIVWRLTRRVVK